MSPYISCFILIATTLVVGTAHLSTRDCNNLTIKTRNMSGGEIFGSEVTGPEREVVKRVECVVIGEGRG